MFYRRRGKAPNVNEYLRNLQENAADVIYSFGVIIDKKEWLSGLVNVLSVFRFVKHSNHFQ